MDTGLVKKVDKALNKFMPFITPTGVLMALVFWKVLLPLKPMVNFLFGIMTFFGAMKISIKDMTSALKRPLFILSFVLASYIIMPLVAQMLSLVFFPGNRGIGSGFNLVRAIPTAVVGSIWATIYNGNLAVALTVLLLDTILAPFLTPFMLRIFTGTTVAIDSLGMMKSLLLMVVLPFFLGLIANHFFARQIKEKVVPVSNPLSKILLLLVVTINVSQVSERLISELSWSYALTALVAVIMSVSGFPVGLGASRLLKLGRGETVSITFAVAMRNISAALVLAIQFLPEAAALPAIFSIVCQQSVAAVIGHRFFGREGKSQS